MAPEQNVHCTLGISKRENVLAVTIILYRVYWVSLVWLFGSALCTLGNGSHNPIPVLHTKRYEKSRTAKTTFGIPSYIFLL